MPTSPRDYFSGWTPQPFTRRNMIINGCFRVWQRGTGGQGLDSKGYISCDRWNSPNVNTDFVRNYTEGIAQVDISRTTSGNNAMAIRQGVEIKDSDTNYIFPIEIGTPMTMSFEVHPDAACNVSLKVSYRDGVAAGGAEVIILDTEVLGEVTDTTGFTKFTKTFTIESLPAAANRVLAVLVVFNKSSGDWAQDTDIVRLRRTQLELGAKATEFEFRHYEEELALCQRYYWLATGDANTGFGRITSTTTCAITIPTPVNMRNPVTAGDTGGLLYVYANGGVHQVTGPYTSSSSVGNGVRFNTTIAGTSTNHHACTLRSNTGFITLDAEL